MDFDGEGHPSWQLNRNILKKLASLLSGDKFKISSALNGTKHLEQAFICLREYVNLPEWLPFPHARGFYAGRRKREIAEGYPDT